MGKEPYDPFEFAEDKADKEFRKGFVMDTNEPIPKDIPEPVIQKPKRKKRVYRKKYRGK